MQTVVCQCHKDYCHFVVWTEQDMHLERTEPNHEFWTYASNMATHFFRDMLLLELFCAAVGGQFRRKIPFCKRSLHLSEAADDGKFCLRSTTEGTLCRKETPRLKTDGDSVEETEEEGDSLGGRGHGKLTDNVINRLQIVYNNAIHTHQVQMQIAVCQKV